MMNEWKVSNCIDLEGVGETWIYYESEKFPDIHMSRCLSDGNRDHMATNDKQYYFFGVGGTKNTANMPYTVEQQLKQAWEDYFSVR